MSNSTSFPPFTFFSLKCLSLTAGVGLTKGREMRGSRGAQHLAHTWEVEVGPHGRGRLAAGPGRGWGDLCVSLPLEQWEAPMTQFCPEEGEVKARPLRTGPEGPPILLPTLPSACFPTQCFRQCWAGPHTYILCWSPGHTLCPFPRSAAPTCCSMAQGLRR